MPGLCHRRIPVRTSLLGLRLCAALALIALTACEGDGPRILETQGTGIEPASLTVHLSVVPEDTHLADALGWTAGVPGGTVRIRRLGSERWMEAATEADGTVTFPELVGGRYRVVASRVLSPDEAADAELEIRAFGDGRFVQVGRGTEASLELKADEPGTLVISEAELMSTYPWERAGAVTGGKWFEIYNNSGQTQFLDGITLGRSYSNRGGGVVTCEMSGPMRIREDGIHVRLLLAFPGDGTDYPLAPGEAVVVAAGAADHGPVHPSLPDLREADFEILTGTDNPEVPNMRDIGISPATIPMLSPVGVYFLGVPVDAGALPRTVEPYTNNQWMLFPAEAVIDAVGLQWEGSTKECATQTDQGGFAHKRFERHDFSGFINDGQPQFTAQRRALRTAPDGRVVLQNTNTGAADFFRALRTPGEVPQP